MKRGHCVLSRSLAATPLDLQEHTDLELARDRAEGIRLAYVVATRARELLVVPTVGDDPRRSWESVENWWVRPLYDAIYPEPNKRQFAATAGEDRRPVGQAGPVLLALAGGKSSDTAFVRKHGAADRGAADGTGAAAASK